MSDAPTADRVFESEEMLVSYLKALDPSVDAAVGTAVRELAVVPSAALRAYQDDAFNSLMDALSAADGSDEATAELVMSNLNVTRRTGAPGSGYVALYFTTGEDAHVPQRITFQAGDNTLVLANSYVGTTDYATLGVDDGGSYRPLIQSGDLWLMTVPASTKADMAGTIAEGQPLTASENITYLDKAEVAVTFTGGGSAETIEDMRARLKSGPTAKMMSGKAHIEALIGELSTVSVLDMSITGAGDPDMLRASRNVYGVNLGGKVDVYVKTAGYPVTRTLSLTATCVDAGTMTWRTLISKTDAPGFYTVVRVGAGSATLYGSTDHYDLTFGSDVSGEEFVPDLPEYQHARFSKYQNATLQFIYNPGTAPTLAQVIDVEVDVVMTPSVEVVQDVVTGPEAWDVCGDYVVKGAVPVIVGVEARIRYPLSMGTPGQDALRTAIANAVNATPMRRGYLTTSDLVDAVKSVDSRYLVEMPMVLTGAAVAFDGSYVYARSLDTLKLDKLYPATTNTAAFMCSPSGVALTMVGGNQYLT